MNKNKYPSLEWCEMYGHLFPESESVWRETSKWDIEDRSLAEGDYYEFIGCPDALEIMQWWGKKAEQVKDYTEYEEYFVQAFYADNPMEDLMQAVELVEAK